MSLPSSTAPSSTPYVGNVDQAAVLANQPNARTDANRAYGQAVDSQNVISSKTPPTTPNNSGTSSPTKKFQPPP
jgi:hypothetical protein